MTQSPAIIETNFSDDKDIWIAVTDYYMYIYFNVLFLLLALLQKLNFSATANIQTFSLSYTLFSLLTLSGPLHN